MLVRRKSNSIQKQKRYQCENTTFHFCGVYTFYWYPPSSAARWSRHFGSTLVLTWACFISSDVLDHGIIEMLLVLCCWTHRFQSKTKISKNIWYSDTGFTWLIDGLAHLSADLSIPKIGRFVSSPLTTAFTASLMRLDLFFRIEWYSAFAANPSVSSHVKSVLDYRHCKKGINLPRATHCQECTRYDLRNQLKALRAGWTKKMTQACKNAL